MKMKHTPGPWELSDDGNHIIGDCNQDELLEVANLTNTFNLEANARLIAAAPELLDALKASLSYLENIVEPNHTQNGLIDYLKHTITEAEGRNESSPAL